MERLFERLAEACPEAMTWEFTDQGKQRVMTDDFMAFKAHALAREAAGRDTFGFAYLDRDNPAEALEEIADFCIYLLLDSLKAVRKEGEDADVDVVLTAIRHAYMAYNEARHLRSKRLGAP